MESYLWVWLLLLTMMAMKFIHVALCGCSSFFYLLQYFFLGPHHNLFIHYSFNGHLGSFHFWASTNNAAMNIDVHGLGENMYTFMQKIDKTYIYTYIHT